MSFPLLDQRQLPTTGPKTSGPSPDLYDSLAAKIEGKNVCVGVVGLGYVGLPLARAFAAKAFPVIGFDVDPFKVAKLRRGESYIGHIPDEEVHELRAWRFEATTCSEDLAKVDVVIICVPTPLTRTREPDLTFVAKAAEAIAAQLRPGQLVVLESTTYPGTTRELVLPALEAKGLKAGKDFFLAFSPEREDPGNFTYSTTNIPKVVGGFDARSLKLAASLYAKVISKVVPVSSLEVAEACKILENTYRAVNIALVNELKTVFTAMGIDVWEVIEAARTKPFGFQAFYPGPGLGGHCIPIDPFYLSWAARCFGLSTRFIELAGEVNSAMPQYVVTRVAEALNEGGKALKGSRVCVLGVAYKKDVDDPRESPALAILEGLQARGAVVSYNDPHVPVLPRMRHHALRLDSTPLTPEFLAEQDCVLIVTDHSRYDYDFVVENARLIVDTRNATADCATPRARIVKA